MSFRDVLGTHLSPQLFDHRGHCATSGTETSAKEQCQQGQTVEFVPSVHVGIAPAATCSAAENAADG